MRNVTFIDGSFNEMSGRGAIDFRVNLTSQRWRAEFADMPAVRLYKLDQNLQVVERAFDADLMKILRPDESLIPHWNSVHEFHATAAAWSIGLEVGKERGRREGREEEYNRTRAIALG